MRQESTLLHPFISETAPKKNRVRKKKTKEFLFSSRTSRYHAPQSPRTMSCLICGKQSEPGKANYCPAHNRAYHSVRDAFSAWTTAYGSLSSSDFLKRAGKLPGTGRTAREIVEFLQRNPARWK